MATLQFHLETALVFEGEHRITETREPNARLPARFLLARGSDSIAWAVRTDVKPEIARELDELAASEPLHTGNWEALPIHAARYEELLAMDFADVDSGPMFEFPAELAAQNDLPIVEVRSERELATNFHGWVPGEISNGCAPVMAIVEDGAPVSICFSARRSRTGAVAGVDTGERYRGRGYAARVTAAWALAIRARKMTPLYNTSWSNDASRAVAKKLGLVTVGSTWSMS